MKPFAYVNPANEKEAVAALSKEYEKSLPIGGGQDLLARMKDYITQPDRLVNVKSALESRVTAVNGGATAADGTVLHRQAAADGARAPTRAHPYEG